MASFTSAYSRIQYWLYDNSRSLIFCFTCVIFSRLMLMLIGIISLLLANLPVDAVDLWYHWDANWYMSIASEGYHMSETYRPWEPDSGQTNINFFPLLPATVWLLSFIFPGKIAGLVVSNIFLFLGCATLHQMAQVRFGNDIARWSVISVCFFPGSFVFSTTMTESLFFMLSTMGFYHLWQQKWLEASICGGLLSVTRPNGIFFTVAAGVGWLRLRLFPEGEPPSFKGLFFIALGAIPLCLFMLFLFLRFNDAFAYANSQLYLWHNFGRWPLQFLVEAFQTTDIRNTLRSGLAMFMILLFLVTIRRFTLSEITMVLLTLLIITTSQSAVRYLLPLFQFHLSVGFAAAKDTWGIPVIVSLAALNGLLMVFWVRGDAIFV